MRETRANVIPQDKTKTSHYDHCPHSTMSSKDLIKEP